jgi:hypothetical protein
MNCKLQEDFIEALNGHMLTPKIPTFVDKICPTIFCFMPWSGFV